MNNRLLNHAWLIILCFLFSQSYAQTQERKEQPNVLIIVADDLGYGDLGWTGHPHIKTPNIDKLAEQGVSFSQFYAPASVCSPSRASMITGRMSYRLGIYGFIHAGDPYVHLPVDEITIPQLFRKAGYQTALIGKWHVSWNDSRKKWPHIPSMDQYGFDYWFSSDNNTVIHNKPAWWRNGKQLGTIKGYAAEVVATEAIDWITTKRDKTKPFLQYVHFYEPHWLIEAPGNIVQQYDEKATQIKNEAIYFAAVAHVDLQIGRIIKALETQNLSENTIVLFTSDHGPANLGNSRSLNRNYGTAKPYRGNKYGLWDGSIHVPGIIRWPKGIQSGTEINNPVGSIDILPTLCTLVEIKIPKDLSLDGADFSPLLFNKPMQRVKPLQWHHYNATLHHQPNPNAVIRDGDFIICGFYDQSPKGTGRWVPGHMSFIKETKLKRFTLYNLTSDPTQQKNISGNHPELFEKLRTQLIESHTEIQVNALSWQDNQPVLHNN
ncbi:MAG: sulfatase family protein [Pirellulales bacterium]